jgi:hypothetical protein
MVWLHRYVVIIPPGHVYRRSYLKCLEFRIPILKNFSSNLLFYGEFQFHEVFQFHGEFQIGEVFEICGEFQF